MRILGIFELGTPPKTDRYVLHAESIACTRQPIAGVGVGRSDWQQRIAEIGFQESNVTSLKSNSEHTKSCTTYLSITDFSFGLDSFQMAARPAGGSQNGSQPRSTTPNGQQDAVQRRIVKPRGVPVPDDVVLTLFAVSFGAGSGCCRCGTPQTRFK